MQNLSFHMKYAKNVHIDFCELKLTYWSKRDTAVILIFSNFHSELKDSDLEHFQWSSLQVNANEIHQWLVNIGSGNAILLYGNEAIPELTLKKF